MPAPWVLAADSPEGLRQQARELRARLQETPEQALDRGAPAFAGEGAPGRCRAVALGRNPDDLLRGLVGIEEGRRADGVVSGEVLGPARVAFVFSPLRSEYEGMGVDLLDNCGAFRDRMEACEAALSPFVDWSLDEVLRGRPGVPAFHRLDVSQPVLFAMGVSLARLWDTLGVRPEAVVGHSVGEIAAAATCGALTLPEAARVASTWGRSSRRLEGTGAMALIQLPAADLRKRAERWSGRLWISGFNAPASTAISGETEAVNEMLEDLAADGVVGRSMGIAAPGHSPAVAAIDRWFMEDLSEISPRRGGISFYSAVVGRAVDPAELDALYWSRNLRHPVHFEPALRSLQADGYNVFIEVGPRPVLAEAIGEILDGSEGVAIGTLDQGHSGYLLTALAKAFVNGVEVDWGAVCGDDPEIPLELWSTPHGAPPRDGDGGALAHLLTGVPPGQQEAVVLSLVREEVAKAIGWASAADVDPGRTFKDLGFDSPAAVDLRNRLVEATGLPLHVTLAFDHPTPNAIARKLCLEFEGADRPDAARAGNRRPMAEEKALSRIDELDVASLLELSQRQREDFEEVP